MKSQNIFVVTTITAFVFLGGIIILSSSTNPSNGSNQNNTSIVDGKQIVEIEAKGGYSPRYSYAKALMPTLLKVNTNGTFDCSSALSIPSLNYQKYLPATGETIIEVPPQESGTTLQGTCAMGMYNFAIKFT